MELQSRLKLQVLAIWRGKKFMRKKIHMELKYLRLEFLHSSGLFFFFFFRSSWSILLLPLFFFKSSFSDLLLLQILQIFLFRSSSLFPLLDLGLLLIHALWNSSLRNWVSRGKNLHVSNQNSSLQGLSFFTEL